MFGDSKHKMYYDGILQVLTMRLVWTGRQDFRLEGTSTTVALGWIRWVVQTRQVT